MTVLVEHKKLKWKPKLATCHPGSPRNSKEGLCTNCCAKERRKNNPDRIAHYKRQCIKGTKKSFLKKRYGITVDEYNEMVQRQNSRCFLCDKLVKKLRIDHNHITGKVRALLCNGCNAFLGMYEKRLLIIGKINQYLLT